jgi:hypothetical protein
LNTRILSLACSGALCLIASEALLTFDAVAQTTTVAETIPAAMPDPAERSARSIECAQKADAQGLQGKTRRHFVRECKRGP